MLQKYVLRTRSNCCRDKIFINGIEQGASWLVFDRSNTLTKFLLRFLCSLSRRWKSRNLTELENDRPFDNKRITTTTTRTRHLISDIATTFPPVSALRPCSTVTMEHHTSRSTEQLDHMTIRVLPALADNYMYLIVDKATKEAAIVDPVNPEEVNTMNIASFPNPKPAFHHLQYGRGCSVLQVIENGGDWGTRLS